MAKSRWYKNTGRCPRSMKVDGRRVYVRLRNGLEPPQSWTAHGRGACDWSLTPEDQIDRHPAAQFEIIGWRRDE